MDNVNFEELFGLEAQETPDNQDPTQEQPAVEQKEAPAEEQKEAPAEQTAEEQSKEERARQAFARRIREAEERGARAERERANALIAELDLDDPDNEGQKVSDLDKAAQYISRRRQERMTAGSPTEADIRHIVQEQLQQRQQPPVPQGQLSPQDRAQVDRELAQIAKMDPAMKDLNAILTSDIGPAFRQYVSKGEDFVTSFYKAKELQAQTQQQAAAAEKAKAASKGHLTSTKQQGEGALSVPAEDMAYFRELMPDATAEEIQKYYNADRKRYGPK